MDCASRLERRGTSAIESTTTFRWIRVSRTDLALGGLGVTCLATMLELGRHTARLRRRRSFEGRASAALVVALLSPAVVACGRSGSESSTSKSQGSPTTASVSATTAPSQGAGTSSVSTGPVRGQLSGENHAPKVGREWPYSVSVTDASGHPLSGTVDIEFVFAGQVVGRDTPPTHPVKNGHWHDTLQFPAQAVGVPLLFQAVVLTHLGSITLDWPVTAQH